MASSQMFRLEYCVLSKNIFSFPFPLWLRFLLRIVHQFSSLHLTPEYELEGERPLGLLFVWQVQQSGLLEGVEGILFGHYVWLRCFPPSSMDRILMSLEESCMSDMIALCGQASHTRNRSPTIVHTLSRFFSLLRWV